ncbi:divergent PAP2 family protein [Patescibacteria group bacterium]|nr:divergent PAP2 family protein [Patescibacteria group bacterium]
MLVLRDGIDTPLFMVAGIFALLIRYDAMNLRYESGKHAQYINSLRSEI